MNRYINAHVYLYVYIHVYTCIISMSFGQIPLGKV